MNQKLANPGPMGLVGFGMTTVLLNLHNLGLIERSVVITAMGLAMGGAAQLIAGVLEFRLGNTFGGTAFTAYGLFWWSLVLIWTLPPGAVGAAADGQTMGFYLSLWAVFTAVMFIQTLTHDRLTQVVFGLLTLLFLALAAADFSGQAVITKTAGGIGLVCGLTALIAAFSQLLRPAVLSPSVSVEDQ